MPVRRRQASSSSSAEASSSSVEALSSSAGASSAPLQVREGARWDEEMGSASSPDKVSSFLTIFF